MRRVLLLIALTSLGWGPPPPPRSNIDLTKLLEDATEMPNIVGADGALEFYGEIDEDSGKVWRGALKKAMASKPKHLVIRIDSGGGDFDESRRIGRDLEIASGSTDLVCVVDGDAYSGAFYILQSCGTRQMTARSSLMAHEPYYAQLNTANRVRLTEALDMIRVTAEEYVAHCAARLNMKPGAFGERIRGRDWWMTPADALKVGAVDAVVPSPNGKLRRQ